MLLVFTSVTLPGTVFPSAPYVPILSRNIGRSAPCYSR